jgi:putative thiamine transport system permease protein
VHNRFNNIGAAPLLILFALPLVSSLAFALIESFNLEGWIVLFNHPQLWLGLKLSLLSGFASAALSLITALIIVVGLTQNNKLSSITGAMLAVPHLAVAIGVSFLIMPSGFLARLISALFTGWRDPPNWISNHDPYGFSLIAVLILKETPFLIWILASILNREDLRRSFAGQRAAALSLGHGMNSIWLRLLLPQILPRMIWPLLVTFVYAATVVDMSLVIGPTQPPTLATLVWNDINDAQVITNMRGAAGAWFLTLTVALAALLIWVLVKILSRRRQWLTVGPTTKDYIWPWYSVLEFFSLVILYIIIAATLVLLSLAPQWPFPILWPENLSAAVWFRVVQNPSALITSLVLAFTTSVTSLVLIIAWMESQPRSRDRFMLLLSATALGLPAILVSLGQYRTFLQLGLTGTALGLFIAHLVPVAAYMFIVLVGPYRSFDPRWQSSAAGLLTRYSRFLWAIKLPLLKAPVFAATAIGFAVSFAQYVPAQLISAGRFSTLPMEAVTLTTGTNRPLTAAFTLLLMVPPLVAFLAAAVFSRSRWSRA